MQALRQGPWRLANRLVASPVLLRSSACALGRASRWRRALQLLFGLPRRRVAPGASGVVALRCRWRQAAALLGRLRGSVRCGAEAKSSVLGRWQQALQVEDEVMLTISALGMALGTGGLADMPIYRCKSEVKLCPWHVASLLLSSFRHMANLVARNAALAACERSSVWSQALGCLRATTPRRSKAHRSRPAEVSGPHQLQHGHLRLRR